MGTPTDLFSYDLPPEQIAQDSVEPRDHSRLMILDRKTGASQHKKFFEIFDELRAGDLFVMNNTKVFKARLRGRRGKKEVEVFLLRPRDEKKWEALLKPGRAVTKGDAIDFDGFSCRVVEKRLDGTALVDFGQDKEVVLAFTDARGEVPTPPYVKKVPVKPETYQTVYAEKTGSVAAPTAGFHFTSRLIDGIKKKGVQIEFITLHVGLGTFRPMKTKTIEEHEMHDECVEISASAAQRINQAKQEGRRIIAVGTTTVRTLEGVAAESGLPDDGFVGDVNLFIAPGFKFNMVDALVTNFHLPKSTLLVLVSAFTGREYILAAYKEAIRQGYRFYSFGDAMFIR